MSAEQTRTCDECAGTITADEILRRKAGLVKGRLLCVACVEALRRQIAAERAAASRNQAPASAAPALRQQEQASVDQDEATTSATPRDSAPPRAEAAPERDVYSSPAVSGDEVQSAERAAGEGAAWDSPPAEAAAEPAAEESPAAASPVTRAGPMRCAVFHARTTEAGLADLQHRVDGWLRDHPELVVRSSGVTVGPYDGAPGEHRLYVVLYF